MKRDLDIRNELREVSPILADLPLVNPLRVPDGYFNDLPDVILSRVSERPGLSLPILEKPLNRFTPEGYFDNLAGRVMQRVREEGYMNVLEETAAIAPVLANLSREMPQQVPVGYFEQFAAKTVSGLNQSEVPPDRLIVMSRSSIWRKYAAAAAIVGTISVSAWIFMFNRNVKPENDKSFVEVQSAHQLDTLQVSEKDMAVFLDSNETLENMDLTETASGSDNDIALVDMDDNRLGEALQTLPDHTLSEYIQESPDNNETSITN